MGTDGRRGRQPRQLTAMVVTVGLLALIGPTLIAPLGASAAAPKFAIRADNFRFCPVTQAQCLPTDSGNVVTVAPGTTVTWTYTDTACDLVVPCPGHNVRFGATGGKTYKKDGALLYRRTFTKRGRYTYQCAIHAAFGMTGVIVVGTPAPSHASPPPPTLPSIPTPPPYY